MQGKKAHFIGIAGKGMSAVALLLREQGWGITGSDEGFYPPVSTYLEKAGVSFAHGYKKENIPADADIIVIGKNAKLVPESNEEVKAALESGKKVQSFPDVLEELTKEKDSVVVVGSYGKSTSTALLSWCLTQAGKDPSYFIGEVTKGLSSHAHSGSSNVWVLEGDEYPSSNWDPSPKFLHYNAGTVLLTSATHDHVNIYPTHEAYLAPFKQLLASLLSVDGLLVANAGEQYAHALAQEFSGETVLYSLHDTNYWHPANISYGGTTTFDLMKGAEKIVSLSTTLLGTHNIENIVGVASLLLEKKLLTLEELASGVATFQGVKRRLELLSPASRLPVYEGFGSSYEKARSAIEAMRKHFPQRDLYIVFEPHTFSWRNKNMVEWYDTVFQGAEKVYIYEPASQGKDTHDQLSHEDIVARVIQSGINAKAITSPDEALANIQEEVRDDAAILLLTSGGLDGLIETIPALVEKNFPAQ